MKNCETSNDYDLDEESKKHFQELDQMFEDILKDPKRRITEQLDPNQRSKMKVGEYEEIYDPGFGKMTSVGNIAKFYGKDILRRLKKEQKESLAPGSKRKKNHVSPELYKEIKKIREIKRPQKKSKKFNSIKSESFESEVIHKPKPKKIKQKLHRKLRPDEDYFLPNRRYMIRNKDYLELFKGPSTVYEWIWANIARHGWKDKKGYPIKEKYFDNGFLVYSASLSEIGKQCGGMSKATVGKYIKQFEEAGVLKVEYLQPKGKKRGQSVFILGEWETINGQPREMLYRDQVYLPK